jgi:hypothetical protein
MFSVLVLGSWNPRHRDKNLLGPRFRFRARFGVCVLGLRRWDSEFRAFGHGVEVKAPPVPPGT